MGLLGASVRVLSGNQKQRSVFRWPPEVTRALEPGVSVSRWSWKILLMTPPSHSSDVIYWAGTLQTNHELLDLYKEVIHYLFCKACVGGRGL